MPVSSLRNTTRPDPNLAGPSEWVARLVQGGKRRTDRTPAPGSRLHVVKAEHWALLSVRIPNAHSLAPQEFQRRTAAAYLSLGEEMDQWLDFRPARLWNLVPHIHHPCGEGLDRYMFFNAGRHDAYRRRLGGEFGDALPTATGVGHLGDELVIHLLATSRRTRPVENPRQIAAHRYSGRYGPKPPCFARATLVGDESDNPTPRRLLVGGTASIVGEDTVHVGDLRLQTEETLRNLASLLNAAQRNESRANEPSGESHSLDHFTQLRVYHPRPRDRDRLERHVAPRFPGVRRIEWRRADLCRRDLLVEIEGVADLPEPQGVSKEVSNGSSGRDRSEISHDRTS